MSRKSYDTVCARSLAEIVVSQGMEKPSHQYLISIVRAHKIRVPEHMPSEVRAALIAESDLIKAKNR
jgi:protein-tyrosine-phosphatase